MKQLTKNLIKFNFKGITISEVSKIEFAFSQNMGETPLKVETYPGGNVVAITDTSFGVPWSATETELFKAGEPFYADTRITIKENGYQPETDVIKLIMKPTLFETE